MMMAPQRFLREGDWYAGAEMDGGVVTSRTFDNLMAFWPGMQTLMGKEGRDGYVREKGREENVFVFNGAKENRRGGRSDT